MKKKILIVISALMIFGLAIAVYAINQSEVTGSADKAACCCMGDSCPMKSKENAAADASHKGMSCCGDSCPMKSGAAAATTGSCCDCCGDSCPMKAKESATAQAAAVPTSATEGENSCKAMHKASV
jgi:hypothetical protein